MSKKTISLTCVFLAMFIFFGCGKQSKPVSEVKQTTSSIAKNIHTTNDTDNKQETKQEVKQEVKSGKEQLELMVAEQQLIKEDNTIVGVIKNNRDYSIKDITFEVSYYDDKAKLLGESTEKIEMIEANGTCNFKVIIPEKYLKSFKAYTIIKLVGHK